MASVTLVKVRRLLRERGAFGTFSRGLTKFREYRRASKLLKKAPREASSGELIDFIFSDDAKFIQPFQIHSEIRSLLDLLIPLRPKNVLEIGTANGGTLFLWTRIAAEDANLTSIDLPGGDFGEGYPVWKIPLYKSFALPGQSIHLLRANSHSHDTAEKAKDLFQPRPVDFLFIDGDHSYEGVKQDFELYSPLVRSGGIIALHDVAPHSDVNCQVDRHWAELKSRFQYHEFIEPLNHGWGGIGVVTQNA